MIIAIVTLEGNDEVVLQTLYNKIGKCDKTIELSAAEKQILTILTRNMLHSIKCEPSTKDNNTK